MHAFLKTQPWHVTVIVSPVPSKHFRFILLAASLTCKCLFPFSNAHPNLIRAYCFQSARQPQCLLSPRDQWRSLHGKNGKSKELCYQVDGTQREAEKQNFFNILDKWDFAATGCHIRQTKQNTGHFQYITDCLQCPNHMENKLGEYEKDCKRDAAPCSKGALFLHKTADRVALCASSNKLNRNDIMWQCVHYFWTWNKCKTSKTTVKHKVQPAAS